VTRKAMPMKQRNRRRPRQTEILLACSKERLGGRRK
jgi:hypothetical protein